VLKDYKLRDLRASQVLRQAPLKADGFDEQKEGRKRLQILNVFFFKRRSFVRTNYSPGRPHNDILSWRRHQDLCRCLTVYLTKQRCTALRPLPSPGAPLVTKRRLPMQPPTVYLTKKRRRKRRRPSVYLTTQRWRPCSCRHLCVGALAAS
jgi:hypothetical protein